MDIGTKIKNARMQANLTQEQVAEELNVSRQTISNWENEKTYPDIISIIKMSDLYQVSLDHLLKGEVEQSDYLDYLEESTNVVKSKTNLSKLILLLTYLLIWSISVISFWCFLEDGNEMGYSLLCVWILLPLTTLIISFIIGRMHDWDRRKWFLALGFGFMYMLLPYVTFGLANMLTFHKMNLPEWYLMIVGVGISLVGMGVGTVIWKLKHKQ